MAKEKNTNMHIFKENVHISALLCNNHTSFCEGFYPIIYLRTVFPSNYCILNCTPKVVQKMLWHSKD